MTTAWRMAGEWYKSDERVIGERLEVDIYGYGVTAEEPERD